MYSFLKNLLSPSRGELNILSAFKPMYIALSVFGLMPYSLKLPETQEGVIIIHKSIYFNLLCSVSLILLLYTSCVIHVKQVFDSETSTMSEVLITKMNYLLELFGFIIFSTVTYFCAFKNKFSYVKILNAIVSSNNSLVHHSKVDSLRELYVQVKMITGGLCLLLAVQLTISFTRHETVWTITLVTITFILPQMIQFTLISFYYVLVVMVVGILKNINEQLIDFVQARTFNTSKFSKPETQTVYFHLMETVFVKILETKREINRAFQASILATAIQCFHSLISETYVIYHGLFIQTQTITIHDIINCLTWIGYQLLKIYMISRTGILLKGQIAKIGRSLHNIPTGKEDTRLYLEIQHFSTLIMYQNAELTVYDYFPVDATLMFNKTVLKRVKKMFTYLPRRIKSVLEKYYSIETVFTPLSKISGQVRSPKDVIPFQSPGVYKIDCSCGSSYIGQTIAERVKEHIAAVKNCQIITSAVMYLIILVQFDE